MILRPDKFRAMCINNQYEDFGNHTGFNYRTVTMKHLIVGEWYDFIKDNRYSCVTLLSNGKPGIGTGYSFWEETYNTANCFSSFFSSVAMQRDIKLNQLL